MNGTGGESGQSGQNGADGGDALVLPRSTLTKAALSNAMRVDIAMGGSTNTILHLLAAAQEAEVDFDPVSYTHLTLPTSDLV